MKNADLEKLVDAAKANNTSLKTKDFIERAHDLKEQLNNGLMRVDAIDDPTLRSVALIKLREEVGLRANEFLRLVELLSKSKGNSHKMTSKNTFSGHHSDGNRQLIKSCWGPTSKSLCS